MVLTKTELTPEGVQQEKQYQEDVRSKLVSEITKGDVFKSFNLPAGESEKVESSSQKKSEEEPKEELTEGKEQGEKPEAEEEVLEEETSNEDEEEEMIPKSKVQKRIDALTSRIKQLEAKEAAMTKSEVKTSDPLMEKLEAMSESELKQTKREARLAQIKYADDEVKLQQLIDLEEKCDEILRSAPERFSKAQIAEFNKAAEKISAQAEEDNINLNEASDKIKQLALEIYQSTPEFQKSVQGQAKSLELAYRHFREIHKLSKGKEEVSRLKSQVSTLKKKTSLDSKSLKSNIDTTRINEIRDKAMRGTSRDKVAFFKSDPRFGIEAMIPEEFKEM